MHVQGEQRGPYTIPQIDHMLNSGLIARETLYWHEGMEQWQPVTDLVVVRHIPNPWIKPGIALGVLLVVAVLVRMFGPLLRGEVLESGGQMRARSWRVPMKFDAKLRDWTGGPAQEVAW